MTSKVEVATAVGAEVTEEEKKFIDEVFSSLEQGQSGRGIEEKVKGVMSMLLNAHKVVDSKRMMVMTMDDMLSRITTAKTALNESTEITPDGRARGHNLLNSAAVILEELKKLLHTPHVGKSTYQFVDMVFGSIHPIITMPGQIDTIHNAMGKQLMLSTLDEIAKLGGAPNAN